ncbi:hypothetical protein ACFQH6_10675 [Halobacteriaceae archaeon GCM10025711]
MAETRLRRVLRRRQRRRLVRWEHRQLVHVRPRRLPGAPTDLPADAAVIVLGIVAVILLIALVFAFVGSVMEFVFVESLRSREVHVRRYWSQHFGKGVRLFLFRLVFGLVLASAIVLGALLFLVPLAAGTGPAVPLLGLLVLLPAVFLLLFVVGIFLGFTTLFVVPVMLKEDVGVLEGWRRFWPTLTGQWTQYLVYAVVSFLLNIAAGIVAFVLLLPILILLAIPFGGVVVAVLAATGGFSGLSAAGVAVLVVVGLLFGLLMLVGGALIQVPIQSFLRYYALLVLGDTTDRFDLIPDLRADIRAEAA